MNFKVEKDGWYQCRNPKWVAHVLADLELMTKWPVSGIIYFTDGKPSQESWKADGSYMWSITHERDLVAYLGTERPKQNREIVTKPKKIQSWLKLYDNGEVFGYESIEECEKSMSLAESRGKAKLVETRLIEWEVGK